MCALRPLRIKKIIGKKVSLENGIDAVYNDEIGKLKENDLVVVYGNLVLEKINNDGKKSN